VKSRLATRTPSGRGAALPAKCGPRRSCITIRRTKGRPSMPMAALPVAFKACRDGRSRCRAMGTSEFRFIETSRRVNPTCLPYARGAPPRELGGLGARPPAIEMGQGGLVSLTAGSARYDSEFRFIETSRRVNRICQPRAREGRRHGRKTRRLPTNHPCQALSPRSPSGSWNSGCWDRSLHPLGLGPSGTGRRLGRLDSAGAALGGGSERSHSRVLLRNNSAVRKSTEQGSCGNAGATARARDAIFRCEPKLDAA
jgi:hypothetical protein